MLKVVKFGGSSLASAEQFKKVADIIHADESRRYVVPSAPGKRFKEDVKVTMTAMVLPQRAMISRIFLMILRRDIRRL